MASIPNVTTPVIINATTSLLIQSDFFLRRVCFVSFGHSTLRIGQIQAVESSDYKALLTKNDNELAQRLEQFFAYCGNKKAYVYECGAQPITPLVDSFDTLKQFAYSKDERYEDLWYANVYEGFTDDYTKLYEWAKNSQGLQDGNYARMTESTVVASSTESPLPFKTSITTLTAKVYKNNDKKEEVSGYLQFDFANKTWKRLVNNDKENDFPLYVEFFDGSTSLNSADLMIVNWSKTNEQKSPAWTYAGAKQGYQTWCIQQSKTPGLGVLKEYLTIENKDWTIDRGQKLSMSDDTFKKLLTKDSLVTAIQTKSDIFGQYPDSFNEFLVEAGTVNPDFSEKIEAIQAQIEDGRQRMYIYALPKVLYKYEGTSKLCQAYNGTDKAVYFVVEVDNDEDLASSASFKQFTGNKSCLLIYNNGSKGYSLVGAFLGRFINSIFDITESNPASPINYKSIDGFKHVQLSSQKEAELIENSVTFAGSLVGITVIYNGRTADVRPFDYWYQWDIVAYNLENAVVSILLQGVNNPNQGIKYDQNGIDTLGATIKSRLTKMISYGCITDFFVSLDPATNRPVQSGYIYAIPFAEYTASNPDKYAMELYDGFSFYVRIGKYVRQVILNVTLG